MPPRLALLFVLSAQLLVGQPPAMHLHELELVQHDSWLSIKLKYPELDGDATFNATVRRSVSDHANGFRKRLREPDWDKTQLMQEGAGMNGTYTADTLTNGVISILFEYLEFAPGTHPTHILDSINYDTCNRRVLALADLFQPDSEYATRLSELAVASLLRHRNDAEWVRRGAGPVADNFRVFTLTDTELILHFQRYQVTSYAEGEQQVAIPLIKLAPILREQFSPVQ